MAAASRAVGAAFQPLHDVLQVASVAAALAPHKQPLDHMVADGAHAGAAVAPAGRREEAQPGRSWGFPAATPAQPGRPTCRRPSRGCSWAACSGCS